jgi:hypothetical protein
MAMVIACGYGYSLWPFVIGYWLWLLVIGYFRI